VPIDEFIDGGGRCRWFIAFPRHTNTVKPVVCASKIWRASTPYQQSATAAVPTQLFWSTYKRYSSDGRDGTVSGANSSINKQIHAGTLP
jgi:hypothetical protein